MRSVNELQEQFKQLQSDRVEYESIWYECATYCLPNRGWYGSRPNLPEELYDSTAILSLQVLAAGLQGYLVNPSQRWFGLKIAGVDDEGSGVCLREIEDAILGVFADSNFYPQMHECWLDLGCFGTNCLYSEEDTSFGMRFFSRPPFEIYISENEKGRVDTIFRRFSLSARQAVAMFESPSEKMRQAVEKGRLEEKFTIVHAVYPELNGNKNFASIYFEEGSKHVLSEGGYFEFPFFVARFQKQSNSIWGFSPAMSVLAEMQTLNVIVKDVLEAAEMAVWPPIEMPADGYILPIKLKPRNVIIRNRGFTGEGMKPVITAGNLPVGENEAEKRREAIRKAFYVDLFFMLEQARNMTATEVVKRVEERMLLLGPVLGRVMHEFLTPLIDRVFNVLVRQGGVVLPPDLPSDNYKITYTSPLAKAQKASEITSVQNYLALVGGIAQMDLNSLDNVNFDKITRDLASILDINPAYLREADEVEEIRKIKAAMQAQMAMQGVGSGAEGNQAKG